MENPWPDLGFRPTEAAKRSSFPKAQKRAGKPNATPSNNPTSESAVVNRQSSNTKTPDIDLTPPPVVNEPDEKLHLALVAKIQAEIDSGEKRLVRSFCFSSDDGFSLN